MDRRKTGALARVGGFLRYQILLTLFALDILGLWTLYVNICTEGAVLKQVMEGIQVIWLLLGGTRGRKAKREVERERNKRFVLHFHTFSTYYECLLIPSTI